MKSLRLRAASGSLFAAILLFLAVTAAISQNSGPFSINESPLPAPTGYVNDYAGVIDAATKQQLETKIDAFKKSSNPSTELAVAVVRTTGDRDIFDYSLAVARGWKIGSKESDNPGALLFVAVDDRKYFTQVSRDLEGDLPDGLAGSLQRQYLVPEFRKGNYGKGISDTIDAYIKTINDRRSGVGTPTPANTSTRSFGRSGSAGGAFSSLCCFIIVGLFILLIIARGARGGGGRGGWGGGGFGGAAGALPWIIGSVLSSGGGRSSGSGGSSWGGGGFGGFGGGGDFGGGGGGGSW